MEPTTLLFQTGYLTIDSRKETMGKMVYKLRLPNHEVTAALNDYLLYSYTGIKQEKFQYQLSVYDALEKGDLPGLEAAAGAIPPWPKFRTGTTRKNTSGGRGPACSK